LRTPFLDCLGKTEIDDFCGQSASLTQAHHDVARFDVPVNELLLVHRG
jgi:hypothetical protein